MAYGRTEEVPIIEERISDAESVRSQKLFRKMKVDPQGGIVIKQKVFQKRTQLRYEGLKLSLIGLAMFQKRKARILFCLQRMSFQKVSEVFWKSMDAVTTSNSLLNLIGNFLRNLKKVSSFNGIKKDLIRKQIFSELINDSLEEFEVEVRGLLSLIQSSQIGSDIEIFFREHLTPQIILLRQEDGQKAKRFWRKIGDNEKIVLWKRIISDFEVCLLDEKKGLARINIEDIMTCTLCLDNQKRSNIFKLLPIKFGP